MLTTATSLFVAIARFLFHYNEFVFRCSERSLPCDFWTCYIIIEMLCWKDYIYLMRIDSYDELMSHVHGGTLTYAYTCDIADESLDFDMTPRYWVICK